MLFYNISNSDILYDLYTKMQSDPQTKFSSEHKYQTYIPPASNIFQAYRRNKSIVHKTPIHRSTYLSQKYSAQIYLKREDLQDIRSFKIRGAANRMAKLNEEERQVGIVAASAGNHAQGVAYCCNKMKIKGTIFMPVLTPKLKVNRVIKFGGDYVDVRLVGISFDDALAEAYKFQNQTKTVFIHPFDDYSVIQGQGSLMVEILQEEHTIGAINYVLCAVGGGGLSSGIASYLSQMTPDIKLIAFQPSGSPSMYNSLKNGKVEELKEIQIFCDGAAVKRPGQKTFSILKELNVDMRLVQEGLVSKSLIEMYENQAIVVEPAGAIPVSGLEMIKDQIKGKTVICILSGSNNEISRMPEINLRSKIHQKKQAYYILTSTFMINVKVVIGSLIKKDEQDVILMTTSKKYNVSTGQCLIGLEFENPCNKVTFEKRAEEFNYKLQELIVNDPLLKIITA